MAPKTLGESGRGTHSHSTEPADEIRQVFSQSDRNAESAIGGNGFRNDPLGAYGTGAVTVSGAGAVAPLASSFCCRTMRNIIDSRPARRPLVGACVRLCWLGVGRRPSAA